MNMFTKEITIHDKNWNKFELEISNEWTWNNKYFSICSQTGQWQFEPKNELQQRLLDIWDTYHLNNNDKLPDNFEEDLFKLLDDIQDDEDEYSLIKITIEDLSNEDFINYADVYCEWEVEKLMAACLQEWVSWSWLENVTGSMTFDVEWIYYLICTDEEADEQHRDYIEWLVDDIWFEAFVWWNKSIDVELDEYWDVVVSRKVIIYSNERWNSLNSRDWKEYTQVVNWTTYYLYRQ